METIPKTNSTKVGYIQKPHGINGELNIRFQPEFYETLEEVSTLLIEVDSLLVPFFITGDYVRFRSGETVTVKLEWINSEQQARELVGKPVYVSNDDLSMADGVSVNQLIGFTLVDQQDQEIGPITEVNDFAGNLLLTVSYKGDEVMVPFSEELLIAIDEEKQTIQLDIPDGLLEINEE